MVYAGVLCHNEGQVLIGPSVFFPVGGQQARIVSSACLKWLMKTYL